MVSIGESDASLGEKIFHLAETEAEAVGELDGMADDCGWNAVTVGAGWFGIHRPSLPNPAHLDNVILVHPGRSESDYLFGKECSFSFLS